MARQSRQLPFLMSLVTIFVAMYPLWVSAEDLSSSARSQRNTQRSSNVDGCKTQLQKPPMTTTRPKTAKFLGFNVENLFIRSGPFEMQSVSEFKKVDRGERNRSKFKSQKQIKELADVIKRADPDFAVLTEVDDDAAPVFVRDFLRDPLDEEDPYDTYSIEGNDPRDIQIAILVRKSLGLVGEFRTNKEMTFTDPASGRKEKLFSRDLPVLILRYPENRAPALIIIGNHAKSKRDRRGDKESQKWRTHQYEAAAEIIVKLKEEFPGVTMVLSGDFNTDTRTRNSRGLSPELDPIRAQMLDAFEIAENKIGFDERVTHSYFPGDNPTDVVRQQLDSFFIVPEKDGRVVSTNVISYFDDKGVPLGLPQNYQERSERPSDHNPVFMEMYLPRLNPTLFDDRQPSR